MKYKSEFSNYNFLTLLIPILLVSIINILSNEVNCITVFIPISIFLLVFSLVILTYYTTYYEIYMDKLIISMMFYKTKINILEIRSIKFSNSFLKTNFYKPGFHHRGIEIIYNKYDDIFISPKNQEEFISNLLKINPNIEIKK